MLAHLKRFCRGLRFAFSLAALLFILPSVRAEAGTVTFDANGGSGTMESATITASSDTLPACEYSRYGYIFRGWVTDLSHDTPDYDDQAEVSRTRA